ncbi:MAG TPA: hydroxysqualene dehydroxylase HpnE [Streptosporangiaceae bacterium]|nr:hydroxysqualene dehydroxylase HpnE [Streptosporangiaceae bacterium]
MTSPAMASAAATSPAATPRRVLVVGGGLAGITAAIALREAGLGVTLLEARPRLGGAASSGARGSMMIDTGQHVFLRCCQAYRELLATLGVTGSVTIQDRFDVTVLSADGTARLRRNALPSPLHMAGSLAGYRLLSLPERLRVGRAAIALARADPGRPELDRARLGDWLSSRGQDERARRRLWDLFIVSALNIAGDDASVPLAATVIKTALLGAKDAADIGMATVPLSQLHGTAASALLSRLGAKVRLRTKVAAIKPQPGGGLAAVLSDGRSEPADCVVLAVPASHAARLGASAGITAAAKWDRLGYSPIVNVHVVYGQRVTRLPFAAAVDSPVQWVFDKTRQAGVESGQYLAVSLSAADRYVDAPAAALRQEFLPALERLFPAAAQTTVTDFFVTRERHATFRQVPGNAGLRPGAATSVPGLVLAGAWTDTGWPDTMEGAVRSGHNAVSEVMRQLAWLPSASQATAQVTAGLGAP